MDRKSLLLAIASTFVALLFCEGALRVLARINPKPPAPAAPPPRPDEMGLVLRYAAQLTAAKDTDRRWFLDDPPPLTSRSVPSAAEAARFEDFLHRGLYQPQAQYVWNRKYVEKEKCLPDGVFKNYPETVIAFDPPSGDIHPPYRFPVSATLPSGLVTNQFGLRGPEIALAKPPKHIRIAFVGASTTVTVHGFPFSPAERVGFWLNRYAQARGYSATFEVLNAGREGINSEDIAAIVRDELVALDPDLVVYYEGSNQIGGAPNLAAPRVPGRSLIYRALELVRAHTALGNLVARAGVMPGGEPRKPWHYLQWPAGVDPQNPDVDSPNLPIALPVIVHDLDTIRAAVRPAGGRLVLCSFEWLVSEGMVLTQAAHPHIYNQLNSLFWPLRYGEIRTLADFQNRVYRRYAESRGISFLDVAGTMPQNPDLFSDAIHMTETGERLKAWIIFQQLAPILSQEIESGHLPRSGPTPRLPAPASYATEEISVRCR